MNWFDQKFEYTSWNFISCLLHLLRIFMWNFSNWIMLWEFRVKQHLPRASGQPLLFALAQNVYAWISELKVFSISIQTFLFPFSSLFSDKCWTRKSFMTSTPSSCWNEIPSQILCLLFVKLSCLFLRSITFDSICGCIGSLQRDLCYDVIQACSFFLFMRRLNRAKSDKTFFHPFWLAHFFIFSFFIAVAFFLIFTLNAFRTFYMLSIKSDAIFRLIESTHWLVLTSVGIFALCYLSETTRSAIGDCSQLLISLYSTNVESCGSINHKLDVCIYAYRILLTFFPPASVDCEKSLSFAFCSMNHHFFSFIFPS